MKRYWWVIAIVGVVLLNVAAHFCVLRLDLTDDQRYSLSTATKELLNELDAPVEVTVYLAGDLNPSFQRLKNATAEMVEEMGKLRPSTFPLKGDFANPSSEDLSALGLTPIVIHERAHNGTTVQQTVYPYALVRYKERRAVVSLLQNNRGMSGEENLNASIENLEYAFAEAIHQVQQTEVPRVAFLEGHGELPEQNVYDISLALSKYFQVDRGALGNDPSVLDGYQAVVVADPQTPFSETDKYILDHYIQQGGNVLWVLNGVRFSEDVLAQSGFTPVLALDLNLTDMLFRYGVRVNPTLLQDVQCLPVPVNVSSDPQQPNLQPVPWYYAPLLLTSQASPITRNIGQVSSMFASPVDVVGGEDGIRKEVLLATSTATRLIPTPAEVDLGDLNPDMSTFRYQYVPVAVALEGRFPSVFAHRMVPEGIEFTAAGGAIGGISEVSRQVVVASGSVIRNEIQQGKALPAGYDRYSGMQFANRDFLVNAVLYLTDEQGLIPLRQKTIALRLLNDRRAHEQRTQMQLFSTITPVALLAFIGLIVFLIRRYKYTRAYAARS
ncbi:MAG: gliding motility-associated ABC transporter substrate-binding protein GldG [Paludibacteraceae bacterium]|nr:gliding motility-associated ABC transporter substrate-binding protein GldG [Paludibacteraceae bacterium]